MVFMLSLCATHLALDLLLLEPLELVLLLGPLLPPLLDVLAELLVQLLHLGGLTHLQTQTQIKPPDFLRVSKFQLKVTLTKSG